MLDQETNAIIDEIFENFSKEQECFIAVSPAPQVQTLPQTPSSPLNDAITKLQDKLTELQKDAGCVENAEDFLNGIVMEINQISSSIDDKLAAFNVIKNYQNNISL